MNKRDIVWLVIVGVVGFTLWKVAPQEKTIYKDKPQASNSWCQLPIPVGGHGFIKRGHWAGYFADVLAHVDSGADCAYAIKIPHNQNLTRDVYINVNADNLQLTEATK